MTSWTFSAFGPIPVPQPSPLTLGAQKMKFGLHDHTYEGVKTDMGTAHPGHDLHQTAVEGQPEMAHSANKDTKTSFGSPGCGGGSVGSARPLSTTTPRYGVLILEINPPGSTLLRRHRNLPVLRVGTLASLSVKRGNLRNPCRHIDGARAVC